MSKNNLERERPVGLLTPAQQLIIKHAEKGIVVFDGAKNGRPHIEISLGNGIVTWIDRPSSWDLTYGGDVTEISIKNGGKPLPVAAVDYLSDGRHQLYLLIKDGVILLNPITSDTDLGLDIAYELAAIKHPNDPLLLGDRPHVKPVIKHILESVNRLIDH